MARYIPPIVQVGNNDFSGAGAGWLLNAYSTGTTTRKNTFSDSALTTANANPVVADSSGRFADIFLEAGTYRFILTDENAVTIWDADPVDGVTATTGLVEEKTVSYTVTSSDNTKMIAVDATTGALTVTLLAAATAGDGFKVTVKKTDSSANAVTVDGNGAETIDGAASLTLDHQYEGLTFLCDGSNWHVVDFYFGSEHTLKANLTVQSSDAGAAEAPLFTLDRNSTTPAASDVLGALRYLGKDSGGNDTVYAKILATLLDPTGASEDGRQDFHTMLAGTLANRLSLAAGLFSPNATGGDKGIDTANFSNYYAAGANVGRWAEIATGSLSAAASLDLFFTAASWRALHLVLTDFRPATDASALHARTSTDGSTFDAGASDYQYSLKGAAAPAAGTLILVHPSQGNAANEISSIDMLLREPASAEYKIITGNGAFLDGSTVFTSNYFAGVRLSAGDVNGIQILYSAGNIASGNYKLLGLRE